jgi:hypothetical protein
LEGACWKITWRLWLEARTSGVLPSFRITCVGREATTTRVVALEKPGMWMQGVFHDEISFSALQ